MTEALIIGAGPAGLAAALQLQRRGVDFVIFERQLVGGLLNNANLVENYPGFPGGIAGEDLVGLFHQQVRELGVVITYEEVRFLDYFDEMFKVETERANYTGRVAIIASGTIGSKIEEINIPAVLNERVLTEILPIKGTRGQQVVIIGAGDLAFDYALNLGRMNAVTILNRTQERKCLPLLWERASQMASINYWEHTQLMGIETGEKTGVKLRVRVSGSEQYIHCDYLVYAIGRVAATGFRSTRILKMADWLERKGKLYYIGDVKNGIYRQAAIAVGNGILAATQIIKNMEGRSA